MGRTVAGSSRQGIGDTIRQGFEEFEGFEKFEGSEGQRDQGTGSGERGTGNGERGTGNGERCCDEPRIKTQFCT